MNYIGAISFDWERKLVESSLTRLQQLEQKEKNKWRKVVLWKIWRFAGEGQTKAAPSFLIKRLQYGLI